MTETLTEIPTTPKLTPRERVAKWEPELRANGWAVGITHTEQRARLDATHPSGAVVMVTSGMAGRSTKGATKLYVLASADGPGGSWRAVRRPGLEEFIRSRVVTGYRKRVETKCQCLTRAGRCKTRYATESRADQAMTEARRHRIANGQGDTAECRTYRCPDDDRVWHVSSHPSWWKAPGESVLWDSP